MSKHWLKLSLMLTIGTLFITTTASAITFATGDVFASIGGGQVQVYNPDGSPLILLNDGSGGYTTGSVSNTSTGNFYVTNFGSSIGAFDSHGTQLANFSACGGCASNESILFNAAGDVFVGNAGANYILEFDGAGNPLNTFVTATQNRGTDWIDLNSNQTTIDYKIG